jgi:hypothetical protein
MLLSWRASALRDMREGCVSRAAQRRLARNTGARHCVPQRKVPFVVVARGWHIDCSTSGT